MLCSGCCGDGCGDSTISGFVGDFAGLTYWAHLNEGRRRMGLSSCRCGVVRIRGSEKEGSNLLVLGPLGSHPRTHADFRSDECCPLLNFVAVGLDALVLVYLWQREKTAT